MVFVTVCDFTRRTPPFLPIHSRAVLYAGRWGCEFTLRLALRQTGCPHRRSEPPHVTRRISSPQLVTVPAGEQTRVACCSCLCCMSVCCLLRSAAFIDCWVEISLLFDLKCGGSCWFLIVGMDAYLCSASCLFSNQTWLGVGSSGTWCFHWERPVGRHLIKQLKKKKKTWINQT